MHWLQELKDSEWAGRGELWLDPEGNQAICYDCTLRVYVDRVQYTWTYEGETQEGVFIFSAGGATWEDSWHQATSAACVDVPEASGLFTLAHSYAVPSGADWGWRSKLSQRPMGELVLQMTNITPWGEEGRAVRMVFSRAM